MGAYQQQYSVASARVADDERAIAATQTQVRVDWLAIDKKLDVVRRLAIETYVVNGKRLVRLGGGGVRRERQHRGDGERVRRYRRGQSQQGRRRAPHGRSNEQGQQQLLVRQKD